jgi:hypothetical protein
MEQKININLIIRMYCDHGYSIDAICLRLRYPPNLVETIIVKHGLDNKKFGHN